MNTRLRVPSKVFGSRRSRGRRADGEPTPAGTASPALLTGNDPVLIDPLEDDQAGRSCSYLIRAGRTTLIDPGPATSAPRVVRALETAGIEIDLILLTHLHPDAAAGAGAIAGRYPGARIAGPAGATALLTDPQTMVSEMKQIYGERAENMYGRPAAIESGRIRELGGDSRVELGDRQIDVITTPGHTASHLSFFDPATSSLFCGDALGIQLPGSRMVRPSTPPADFSLDDALASIEKLASIGAATVYLAHYGSAEPGPEEIFDRATDSLKAWHRSFLRKREQTDSDEDLSRQFNACLEATLEPIAPSARRDLERVSPAWLNLAGLTAEQERLGQFRDAA